MLIDVCVLSETLSQLPLHMLDRESLPVPTAQKIRHTSEGREVLGRREDMGVQADVFYHYCGRGLAAQSCVKVVRGCVEHGVRGNAVRKQYILLQISMWWAVLLSFSKVSLLLLSYLMHLSANIFIPTGLRRNTTKALQSFQTDLILFDRQAEGPNVLSILRIIRI